MIREEEKYDGYYAIVTNVFDEGEGRGKFGDAQIIDIYRGLWRVEDSFGITKSELETRPFFLSLKDRIKAHLLICFISLVIVRLVQKRTAFKHSPEKLIEAMNKISCSHEGDALVTQWVVLRHFNIGWRYTGKTCSFRRRGVCVFPKLDAFEVHAQHFCVQLAVPERRVHKPFHRVRLLSLVRHRIDEQLEAWHLRFAVPRKQADAN